jgi:hypothetical protein
MDPLWLHLTWKVYHMNERQLVYHPIPIMHAWQP